MGDVSDGVSVEAGGELDNLKLWLVGDAHVGRKAGERVGALRLPGRGRLAQAGRGRQ